MAALRRLALLRAVPLTYSSSPLNPKLKSRLPIPLFFSSRPPLLSDSDTGNGFGDPPKYQPNPRLPTLINLVSDARHGSPAQEEALGRLKASLLIEPSAGLAIEALWELRKCWESAVLVFKWAGDCVWSCPEACRLMLSVLGKHGKFDLAWGLVRKMYKKSLLDGDAMVVLMERYAAANETEKAIKTFHALEKFKINPDSTVFYALIRALCRNKNIDEAEELLLQKRKYFPLETEGFNIILDGWCNVTTDLVEAKRVWREMSRHCIDPDAISYSNMIFCHSKVGNLSDSIRLYDEMKIKGWTPDIVVYNSLIYVLTKENCIKEAYNVLNMISEAGLKPDVQTYNSMIYPLCQKHALAEARQVMNHMIEKCIIPISDTYHAFAVAENLEGTLKLLKNMRDVRCGPSARTFLISIEKFLKIGECGNALRILGEMKRYDVSPDSSHYSALVQALIMHGWIPKAIELYNEMKASGFPGDPKVEKVFNTFLSNCRNHWGRGGKEYIFPRQGVKDCLKGVTF